MNEIRTAAFAGSFYAGDKTELSEHIQLLFTQAQQQQSIFSATPKALVVPHAGYIYSGLTAAIAYQQIIAHKEKIKRVVLLGPSHHFAFDGMAVPLHSQFTTPLGNVVLDKGEIKFLLKSSLLQNEQILQSNQAHEQEHSLEVQLPFLQLSLNEFELIPIVVGQCHVEAIAFLLERYLHQKETLIVISTDLSHFLSYHEAQQRDQQTNDKIMNYEFNQFNYEDACGRTPLAGMLALAKQKELQIKLLDMRNSGDTAGTKDRVVGYGAWSLYE